MSVEGALDRAIPASVRLHWISVAEAATLLGISEVAVRKRLGSGALTGTRCGRSWRVLLAGDAQETSEPAAPQPAAGDTAHVLAQTSEALTALVRDLQRQSLALAAQVGYLQHQLAEAQEQVKLLGEHNETTVEHDLRGPTQDQYNAAQATIAALRAALDEARREPPAATPRRGWRFWRR
jgi:excisionase family DNA binding protein